MTTKMITGKATAKGTLRYAERLAARLTAGHFRQLDEGPQLSTLGLGTYLGADDGATDVLYQDAIVRALELGVNVLDTAVNYLHHPETQLGEVKRDEFMTRIRAAFAALEEAVTSGLIGRYGTATWSGYREDPGAPGYLSLAELVTAARDVGGPNHHFKLI